MLHTKKWGRCLLAIPAWPVHARSARRPRVRLALILYPASRGRASYNVRQVMYPYFTKGKSHMFINAGPLFGRAKAAYERAKATSSSDRQSGQMDALEAIVFSVAALEGFINEAAELATLPAPPGIQPSPPAVKTFARLVEEVERSRGNLQLKFLRARHAFMGEMYDTGSLPFQDFALLVDLRNALMHYRSLESFHVDKNGVLTFTPAKILKRLRSKDILAEREPSVTASWLLAIATVAMARWSCKSAAAMVASLLNMLPESHFKEQMEFFYRQPFLAPK
jgi:hypothetical protein